MRKIRGVVGICAAVLCCWPVHAEATAQRSVHTVVKGDCLWDIAAKCCGQPEHWRKLYNGNKRKIKNPELIYPGQMLAVTCLPEGIKVDPVTKAEADAIVASSGAVMSSAAVAMAPVASVVPAEPAVVAPRVAARPDADARLLSELEQMAAGQGRLQEGDLAVSPEMPADMTWGFPSQDNKLVSPDWTGDGKIVAADLNDPLDTLASFGDTVQLELRVADSVRSGEFVFVYRRGNVVKDGVGKSQLQLQRSAALKIRAVNGKTATAEVVRAINPVEVDDVIMK